MAKSPNHFWATNNKALWNYLNNGIGDAIDDLHDVIEWLREEGQFDKSDRLRAIAGRLALLQRPRPTRKGYKPRIREIARGWWR